MADFAAFQSFALELEKESDTRESIKKITKEIGNNKSNQKKNSNLV